MPGKPKPGAPADRAAPAVAPRPARARSASSLLVAAHVHGHPTAPTGVPAGVQRGRGGLGAADRQSIAQPNRCGWTPSVTPPGRASGRPRINRPWARVFISSRRPTGCRSSWYEASTISGARPVSTAPSFQPGFTASWIPVSCPAAGRQSDVRGVTGQQYPATPVLGDLATGRGLLLDLAGNPRLRQRDAARAGRVDIVTAEPHGVPVGPI